MSIPDPVRELIDRFDRNIEPYRSGQYNETQVRLEFVDPFFKALGWDVHNEKGYAEAYKDVIHEESVKIGSATKAPDYSFRIGGVRKFFVETKKPSINLKEDVSPAFQLKRYAWSAKLPLSVLTDFEEFAVYDCRVKPAKTDSAATARVMYLMYKEYAERWDDIVSIFSRDAVLKGSFDKFAESTKIKKGTAQVDDAFLKEIEVWRELLAKNIALRNPKLTQRDLNYAVQVTIDRIIFLRICEDRGIEEYGRLLALLNGTRVYERLREVFYRADERYNSGLFHFQQEKNRSTPHDELTPALKMDDKVLKDIIKRLYYPDSPYEFSVLSADILGQVYEQFLGKVIRLTAGHRATVEDKPEVKKAGGVYYTPTYIVDYIVKNTVGRLLYDDLTPVPSPVRRGVSEERGEVMKTRITPKQASKLRILDPACGSGSFLLGAYQHLLDWHLQWYVADGPEKHQKELYEAAGGDWRLTTAERKRILLNNIYGVDIDPQAVEVTKLSLLLKVLEGENDQTLSRQLRFFHEPALPDLGNNIKCGNSLIGPDFYDGQQLSLMDDEERMRINVFDWEKEFTEIFSKTSPLLLGEGQGEVSTGETPPLSSPKRGGSYTGGLARRNDSEGGFDAVIGNPPYGFHQIHTEQVKTYFKSQYVSSHGSFEHYFLFYEKTLKLLKRKGLHGFIVPVTWLTIPSARSLRQFVLKNYAIKEIVWLPELVFKNAQVNTLVTVIQNWTSDSVEVAIYDSLGFRLPPREKRFYEQHRFVVDNYFIGIFEDSLDSTILRKLENNSVPLSDIGRPCSGYNPYEVGKGIAPNGSLHTKETVKTKPYHSEKRLSKEWKPEIVGRDLSRYDVNITGKRWIKYGPWLAAPRDPENFKGKRILVQEITGGKERRIVAVYYDAELYHSRDVIPIKMEKPNPHPLYVLGIVNSNLLTWFHHKRNPKAQKGLFPKLLVSDLKRLPIRTINFSDPADKSRHDKMVGLVEQMLELHKKLAAAKTEHEKIALQRQIDATDKQIDQLVYELYELSEEEVKIVEGKNNQ